MKYFVIATKWDSKKGKSVKQVVGAFDSHMMADIFRKAYDEHFSAHSSIVETADLVQAFYED